jgi:small subunit ribosomal protein S9
MATAPKKTTIKKTAAKKASTSAKPSRDGAAPKKVAAKKVVTKKVAAPKKAVAKKVVATEEVVVAPVEKKVVAAKKAVIASDERYIYAVGRRKTAVAQVRLYPVKKGAEATLIANGGKTIFEYFGTEGLVGNVIAPLKTTGLEAEWSVSILVRGGGKHGQSDAAKLGVARALLKHDPLLRAALKAEGFLTRDARSVERKKPGLKKARKSPQWSKR